MDPEKKLFKFPLDAIPLDRFCELTGYTPSAIRTRISRAQWAQGDHYFKDPLGQLHISLSGFERWVRSGQE